MELGVVEGTVRICEHDDAWAGEAQRTIEYYKELLKDQDISEYQHVGSTAIKGIPAKPIIDIAAAIKDESVVEKCRQTLLDAGYKYLGKVNDDDWMYYTGHPGQNDRTHHLHLVTEGSLQWLNYVAFRDYLNAFPEKAKIYEDLKRKLAATMADKRKEYHDMKIPVINQLQEESYVWWENRKENNK